MRKKKILSIIIIALITFFVTYFALSIINSDKNTFEDRWDIELPKNTKVNKIYSDIGFFGEGYRIIKLETDENDVEKLGFKFSNYQKGEERFQELANQILEKSKLDTNKNDLQYIGTQENGQEARTLIFTYNEKENCYYLFEENL